MTHINYVCVQLNRLSILEGSALKILQKIGLGKEKGGNVGSLSIDVVSTPLNHLLVQTAHLPQLGTNEVRF